MVLDSPRLEQLARLASHAPEAAAAAEGAASASGGAPSAPSGSSWGEQSWGEWFVAGDAGGAPRPATLVSGLAAPDYRGLAAELLPGFFSEHESAAPIPQGAADLAESVEEFFDAAGPEALLTSSTLWQATAWSQSTVDPECGNGASPAGDGGGEHPTGAVSFTLDLECPFVSVSAFHAPVAADLADRQRFSLEMSGVTVSARAIDGGARCHCAVQALEVLELCLPTASWEGGVARRAAVSASLPRFSRGGAATGGRGGVEGVAGVNPHGGLLRHSWVTCHGDKPGEPGLRATLEPQAGARGTLQARADLASSAVWVECARMPQFMSRLREIARPAARALRGLAGAPSPGDVSWTFTLGLQGARLVLVAEDAVNDGGGGADLEAAALALDVAGPRTPSGGLGAVLELASAPGVGVVAAGADMCFGEAAGYLVGKEPRAAGEGAAYRAHRFLCVRPPPGCNEGAVVGFQTWDEAGSSGFWEEVWGRMEQLMGRCAPEDTPAFLEQCFLGSAPLHAAVTLNGAQINVGTMHARCLQRFAVSVEAAVSGRCGGPPPGSTCQAGLQGAAPRGGGYSSTDTHPAPRATVQVDGSCCVYLSEDDLPWSTSAPPPAVCTYRLSASDLRACVALGECGRVFAQARLQRCGLHVASAPGERPEGMICALACDSPGSAHGGLVLTAAVGRPGRVVLQSLRFQDATVWATSGDPSFSWIGGLSKLAARASLGGGDLSAAWGGARGGESPPLCSQLTMAFHSTHFCYLPRAETGQLYCGILAVPLGHYHSRNKAGGRGWTFSAQHPVLHLGKESVSAGEPAGGGSGVRRRQWSEAGTVDPRVMQHDQYVAVWRGEVLDVEFIEAVTGAPAGADTSSERSAAGSVLVFDSEHSQAVLHSDAFRAAQGLVQQLGGDPACLWGDLVAESADDWEMVEAPAPGEDPDVWSPPPAPLGVPHDHPVGSTGPQGAASATVLARLRGCTVALVSGEAWAAPASRILSTTGDGDFEEEGAWDGARSFPHTHAEVLMDLRLQGVALTVKQFGSPPVGEGRESGGPRWQAEASVREAQVDQCDLRQVEFWDSGRYRPDPFEALDQARALEEPWRRAVWVWQTARMPRAEGACFLEVFAEAFPCPVAREGGPAMETFIRVGSLPLRVYLTQRLAQFLESFFAEGEGGRRGPLDAARGGGGAKKPAPRFTLLTEDLHLRLDYKPHQVALGRARQGGRHLYTELLNCVPLHGVELRLPAQRAICAEGAGAAFEQVLGAWLEDVARHQAGQFVAGIRPLKSLSKVGAGASKLITEPLEEYKRQGSVAQGVQRGVSAFAHALSLEVLQMGAHLAAGAQEALRPGGGGADSVPEAPEARAPADLQEGLSQALEQLAWGLDAASAVVSGQVGVLRQSEGGLGSTLVGALRAVPSAVAAPAGAAAGAVKATLQGARNALDQERYYDRLDDDP